MWQRLQKAIAAAGIASRRRAEELIAAGRVQVNGETVREMGTMVDPETQTITVDGTEITAKVTRRYIALHKPVGYVSTVSDPYAPQKVTDLVEIPGVRLVPAGRLDADSEGLMLLSNDGDFIYRVTHPSQSLGKTYLATVEGKPSVEAIRRLTKGLLLPGEQRPTAPAGARLVGDGPEPHTSVVELTLHEGRNRQVRRMLYQVGHPVLRLVRVQVGPVVLGNLKPGKWRDLTPDEVTKIRRGGTAANDATVPAKSPKTGGAKPQEPGDSMTNHRTVSKRTPRKVVAERPKGERNNEADHRGRSRPGSRQDYRKSAS
ncbi:MAG: pseudouridine synthase [Armatimonadaceae bacterium]